MITIYTVEVINFVYFCFCTKLAKLADFRDMTGVVLVSLLPKCSRQIVILIYLNTSCIAFISVDLQPDDLKTNGFIFDTKMRMSTSSGHNEPVCTDQCNHSPSAKSRQAKAILTGCRCKMSVHPRTRAATDACFL